MSAASAARWLAGEPDGNLRIARDIIIRREAYRDLRDDAECWFASGQIDGMRRALAMLSGRPGDISQTGAEGYVSDVRFADELVAEGAGQENAL